MTPLDALKTAYQAAFGAEHLLRDPSAARKWLHEELSACPASPDTPLFEALSPDTQWVHLAAWKAAGLPEEWLAEAFVRSCVPRQAGEARFLRALQQIDTLADAGETPFSAAAWQAEKQAYLSHGLRPVHHSERFRDAEHPAYRVVDHRYARVLALLAACPRTERPIVALDGRCASGKSTLAEDAAEIAGAGIVHMDDFFLPPALRTPERLAAPGGNVHHERFAREVLPALRQGGPFRYTRFDCSRMALADAREVGQAPLILVEGAYSCHPALGDYMDLRVFSDVEPDLQMARIRVRNGEAGAENFRTRWIPMEEAYFSAFSIREKADLILSAQASPSGDTFVRPPRR